MAFFHVCLFVYAIGGDIAVYYIGNYLTKDELSLEERLRVRSMRFIVDMSARTSLVLLLPIGFTLATSWGSSIRGSLLAIIWVFCIAWLILVWMVHFKKGTSLGELLRKIDLIIRYLIASILACLGTYTLSTNNIIVSDWLSLKIILFGAILFNGIWIRSIVGKMAASIERAKNSNHEIKERGENEIKNHQSLLNKAALLIWLLVIMMAFLGEVKPF
ncbi:MAG: hypothetical protein HOH08_08140 [Gammaproteobacteria bacterium]|jgi:small-conductance mechanosensitive channel|nr:hypothetical protein [Gammaproteobacteria bacterium]MBT5541403.1 hypothetical protein [Gammaproteobacteria bacterium]MBT6074904.1 hypothetical protein [Gammaproteobacteria bacterium]MBT7753713.1 hypothetical protein [Gammaproteobacteria bacterium]